MNVVEHPLCPKLVENYLYERNIVEHGGVFRDSKLATPGAMGCLLSHHTVDSETLLWWRCERWPDFIYHQHQMSVKEKLATFGQGCDKCRKLVVVNGKFSSVPEVQAYWDWDNNGLITPDKLPRSAHKKINLRCKLNHEFGLTCNAFDNNGTRCPYCANIRTLAGFNTFDLVPEALEYWDTEENDKIGLKITDIFKSTKTKANFICSKKHKFILPCCNFTAGTRCYYCKARHPLAGFNTFDTIPEALEYWDTEENDKIGLKITDLCYNSRHMVNLKCKLGHKFKKSCYNFKLGSRCYYCSGKKPLAGFNTFDLVPEALEYWDTEENDKIGLKITDFTRSSDVVVFLKCKNGHKFTQRCNYFTDGYRCGICSNKIIKKGINTFNHIEGASEWWDTEENDKIGLKIDEIARSSQRIANFKCPIGHKFSLSCSRFYMGGRCYYCSGKKPLAGFNTFDTLSDAKEWWDTEENDKIGLKMIDITPGSHKLAYFRCKLGHSFKLECTSFRQGNRCPYCTGRRPLAGFNTFDLVPEALEYWDTEENDKIGLKITDVTTASEKHIYLKCKLGHKFIRTCNWFKSGYRCAICDGKEPLAGFNTFDLVPEALEYWDTEENDKIGLKITDVTTASQKIVNLICKKRHKFTMSCGSFKRGNRCNICAMNNYSKISIEYLDNIIKKYNISIRHAVSGTEFIIPGSRYKADGYVEINGEKIVIEFHGDYYHGYKGLTKQDEMSFMGKTFGELYQKTLVKEAKIRELGYTLIVIWESDYLAARDRYLSGDFAIPEIEAALAKK
ncbi:hypothetical protein F-liban_208 [Faustovirus]|nr:hypothetical protein F-liban_208 [Faustovirus]